MTIVAQSQPNQSALCRLSAAPGWMITFADLLSLLLAFFVMMFAATSIDQPTWQRNVAPLARYFSGRAADRPAAVIGSPKEEPAQHDSDYIAALLEHLVDSAPSFKGGTVRRIGNQIVLKLPVDDVAKPTLAALAPLIAGIDNRIDVRVIIDGEATAGAAQPWHRAIAIAMATAGSLSELASGRPVGSLGAIDAKPKSTGARTEFVIYPDKVEAPVAVP